MGNKLQSLQKLCGFFMPILTNLEPKSTNIPLASTNMHPLTKDVFYIVFLDYHLIIKYCKHEKGTQLQR